MKLNKACILLLGIAMMGLGACDKLGLSGNSTDIADPAANQKLDSYVGAYNKFLGTFGFTEKVEDYRESDIAHATVNGEFRVGAGTIDDGIQALKAARVMSGGAADLDKAADALIASMTKVQTRIAALEPYYKSKKYLDDALARGKSEDGPMLTEIAAAEKDLLSFSKLLDTTLAQRDAAILEKLKTGDQIEYNVRLALMHSKKLIDIFNGVDDPTKADVIAKGDAEVAIIEKAMADAQAAAQKKSEGDPAAIKPLTDMLSYYRTFKQRDEQTQLGYMLIAYNQAIEATNGVVN